jgi:LysR family transcriptional regulator, low CO2-responsive transcriptional regulator
MELHRLRCFHTVVEEGGFQRATTRLRVTQPALSYQIKHLEQELKTRLFDRRPGGVSLTEAGRVLMRHAQVVFESVRNAESAVQELGNGVVGEVRVGVVNTVGRYFLPQVLGAMRTRYPEAVTSLLCRRDSQGILDALLHNRLDLAIVADPRPDRRLLCERLFEEPFWLVCGRKHPLFGRTRVSASELAGLQFVGVATELPTGALIERYLGRAGVSVRSMVISDDLEIAKKMVELGLGVALLPHMILRDLVGGKRKSEARLWRSAIDPPLARQLALVTWRHGNRSRAVSTFIEVVRGLGCEWRDCMSEDCA